MEKLLKRFKDDQLETITTTSAKRIQESLLQLKEGVSAPKKLAPKFEHVCHEFTTKMEEWHSALSKDEEDIEKYEHRRRNTGKVVGIYYNSLRSQ